MLKESNLVSLTSHYDGFVKIADSHFLNGVLLYCVLGTLSVLCYSFHRMWWNIYFSE